jgi:hypothetical protein
MSDWQCLTIQGVIAGTQVADLVQRALLGKAQRLATTPGVSIWSKADFEADQHMLAFSPAAAGLLPEYVGTLRGEWSKIDAPTMETGWGVIISGP